MAVPGNLGIPGTGNTESGKIEPGNAEPGKFGLGACLSVTYHYKIFLLIKHSKE